ncbi:protein giant-like [Amphibalanus amphitrite]|uniref:protein giant-like n=1 Tax=Amphibalanus amphitrite TaxID=1232801 RepID=UPI001C909126|nr:protein giant-like [Amphibalanus amphitrite]
MGTDRRASKRQTGGGLGRFQPVDLPLLLPASFRACSAVSSAKPPPPPLLPYPAGGKESGDLKNGESLVAEREAETEKLKADPLRRRQADDASSDQSSKWFNPQEKDFNFSWGETLDALQNIAGRSSSSSEMRLPVLGESRRQKNNEAAKRSRDARRAKEDGVAVRCALLEAENVQLRLEMAWLKNETARLKYVLYST